MTAYFSFWLAPIFILMGIASYFDLHALPLLVFLVTVGVVFVGVGIGYTQVAKRNSAAGKE